MPERTFSPMDMTNKQSPENKQALAKIKQDWQEGQPNQPCIYINGCVLIDYPITQDTVITMKEPRKPNYKFLEHLPDYVQELLKQQKDALSLTKDQIKKILKNVESSIVTLSSAELQEHLTEETQKVYEESLKEKQIKNIKKLCESLFMELNSSLQELDSESKAEMQTVLDDLISFTNKAKKEHLT